MKNNKVKKTDGRTQNLKPNIKNARIMNFWMEKQCHNQIFYKYWGENTNNPTYSTAQSNKTLHKYIILYDMVSNI